MEEKEGLARQVCVCPGLRRERQEVTDFARCVCKTDQQHVSKEELWVQEIIAVEVGFIASCGFKEWSELYTVRECG